MKKIVEAESNAARQAHQLGYTYSGRGYWVDDHGKTVARTVQGVLEPYDPRDDPEAEGGRAPDEETQALGPPNYFAQKVGDAQGSNPGGIYQGSDGIKRYAKFYREPSQAYAEHLASFIYRALRIPAPKSIVTSMDGDAAYVSNMVKNSGTYADMVKNGDKKEVAKVSRQILNGFVADVLLANWDVIGIDSDNIVISDRKHLPVRVDNGGALLYRSVAGRKPMEVLGDIPEFTGFRERETSPSYNAVFRRAGITNNHEFDALVREQILDIDALVAKYGGQWSNLVDNVATDMSKEDRKLISNMLTLRHRKLRKLI